MIAQVAARTDAGLVRTRNEDAVVVGDLESERGEVGGCSEIASERGPLLAVLDGMGGTSGGDVASRLAGDTLWEELAAAPPTRERPVFARHLRRAVRAANRRLRERAADDPALAGMGTTLSAAALVDGVAVLAQVGDSRAYVFRGGRLTQITRDQSLVSALVSAGRLTESEARDSMQRSLILQALGAADDVEVALSIAEVRQGDRLLLCSDGLHGVLEDADIAAVLAAAGDVGAAADALIERARAAGAPDNVSVVLAEFSGDDLAPPLGDVDQPRFIELDPSEEALTETSMVGRRLARRAGLRADTGDETVPATGPHAVVRVGATRRDGKGGRAPVGPAVAHLAARRRVGLAAWLLAIALGAAALIYALWTLS